MNPEESPASADVGWPMSYKGFFPSGGPSIMRVMADHWLGRVPKGLPPHVLREPRHVQQRLHLLDQHPVEMLGNAIQLWRVMDSESASSTSSCEVFIKPLAQVLATMVGAQDFDCSTVVLRLRPCLKLAIS